MALKDWKEIENEYSKNTWKKRNDYIGIKNQFYTRNTAYWDVWIMKQGKKSKKIAFRLKTYKEALAYAKEYMRKH